MTTACDSALPCGQPMTSFNGVPALSNGEDQCGTDGCNTKNGPPGTYGQEYLCTELVDRYYNVVYNISPTNWKTTAKDYCEQHPDGVYVAAVPQQDPQPGDVYVKASGQLGHVAIVVAVAPNFYGVGSDAVFVMEQNANVSGNSYYPVLAPHSGCFLTTNVSHSCDYVAPSASACGMIEMASSSGLPVGAIVGIVVACAVIVALIGWLVHARCAKRSVTHKDIKSRHAEEFLVHQPPSPIQEQ